VATTTNGVVLRYIAVPVPPETLFDNLPAPLPNGYTGVNNGQWTAQKFSTTASGFVVYEVALRLWNPDGTTGGYEVQVWDDSGTSGRPGAQVGSTLYTGLAENLGDSSGSLLTISGLSFSLDPDTNYFIVVRGTSLADIEGPFGPVSGSLAWDMTDVNTTGSYDRVFPGAWNGPYSQDFYMKVTTGLAPGSTNAGLQTSSGALTYADNSTLTWRLNDNDATAGNVGTNFDGIILTNGSLSIAEGAELDLVFDGPGSSVLWSDSFWDEHRSWTIIAPAGTTAIDPANGSFTLGSISADSSGSALTSDRGSFSVSTTTNGVVLRYTRFGIPPLDTPALQTPPPLNNSTNLNPTSGSVAGATGYVWQISSDADFGSISDTLVTETPSASINMPEVDAFFYRIKAVGEAGESAPSASAGVIRRTLAAGEWTAVSDPFVTTNRSFSEAGSLGAALAAQMSAGDQVRVWNAATQQWVTLTLGGDGQWSGSQGAVTLDEGQGFFIKRAAGGSVRFSGKVPDVGSQGVTIRTGANVVSLTGPRSKPAAQAFTNITSGTLEEEYDFLSADLVFVPQAGGGFRSLIATPSGWLDGVTLQPANNLTLQPADALYFIRRGEGDLNLDF
jgi:hypothetical protein